MAVKYNPQRGFVAPGEEEEEEECNSN